MEFFEGRKHGRVPRVGRVVFAVRRNGYREALEVWLIRKLGPSVGIKRGMAVDDMEVLRALIIPL